MMVSGAGTHKMLGSKAKSADPDVTLYPYHFIWVFAVCKSTHLGVSSKQRVKTYSKACLKQPLSKKSNIGFQDRLSFNAGQNYCRMLQGVL